MFVNISQSSTTNGTALIMKQVVARQAKQQQKQLHDAMKTLQLTQSQIQPKNVLDAFIYMPDGSYIDTANNLMTMSNGDQYDLTSGAKYVDRK